MVCSSNVIKYFEKNTQGRDFFVGDIHGCLNELHRKLKEVKFDYQCDRLFSVGDLVDRGQHSLPCADLVKYQWFHAVQGNHENMAIRYPLGNMDTDNYRRNGGAWMIDLEKGMAQSVSDSLKELPYMIEVKTEYGTVGVVHAEVAGGAWDYCKDNIHRKDIQQKVLWDRDKITYAETDEVDGIDFVVAGHTPLKKPLRLGNVFYIDTGAVFGGDLTFMTIQELIEGVK